MVGSLLVGGIARAEDAGGGAPNDSGSTTPDDAATSREAPAPVDPPGSRGPWLTARLALGIGAGSIGASGKYSFSAEGWFGDHVGIGAFAGVSGQTTLSLLGPGNYENDEGAGLALALRSSPGRRYALFSVGGAVARGHEWRTAGLSFGEEGSVPAPVDYVGTSFNVVLGWLADLRAFELGVLADLDIASWGTTTFTVNFAIGFSAR